MRLKEPVTFIGHYNNESSYYHFRLPNASAAYSYLSVIIRRLQIVDLWKGHSFSFKHAVGAHPALAEGFLSASVQGTNVGRFDNRLFSAGRKKWWQFFKKQKPGVPVVPGIYVQNIRVIDFKMHMPPGTPAYSIPYSLFLIAEVEM